MSLPPVDEKPRFVARMFDRIARRYDLMNTLMTAGMDGRWRRTVARAAGSPVNGRALDVGTGTGKLAAALAGRLGLGEVVGVDFAVEMLRAGKGDRSRARFAAADALRLPFGDAAFDSVVSAFVVRNLADVTAGVREQVRVLKPGGRLVILEITPGPAGPMRPLFRLYFRGVVPLVGGLIAGDADAYTYLPESAAAFLEPERLADVLRGSGLVDVRTRRLGLGSVAITQGTRPAAG